MTANIEVSFNPNSLIFLLTFRRSIRRRDLGFKRLQQEQSSFHSTRFHRSRRPRRRYQRSQRPSNQHQYLHGLQFFSFSQVQTYANGVVSCMAASTSQTAYNSRHPPKAPAKAIACNQVVVYVLSDENQPQGIYCAMYTQQWAPNYATNYGQYRGSDYWSVSQAYAYTNNTYAAQYQPICNVGGVLVVATRWQLWWTWC